MKWYIGSVMCNDTECGRFFPTVCGRFTKLFIIKTIQQLLSQSHTHELERLAINYKRSERDQLHSFKLEKSYLTVQCAFITVEFFVPEHSVQEWHRCWSTPSLLRLQQACTGVRMARISPENTETSRCYRQHTLPQTIELRFLSQDTHTHHGLSETET